MKKNLIYLFTIITIVIMSLGKDIHGIVRNVKLYIIPMEHILE